MKHPDDNKTIDMMDKTFSQLESGIKGMEVESRRGRKPLVAAEPVTDVVNTEALLAASSAATQVVLMEQQHTREVAALAVQIGYDGRLEIGAIEDRIRSHMRRTVEECLELGKCLLLLKEMSAHGEFTKRLDLFGIHERVARRLMGATLKFSKTDSKSVLMAAGSQSKLLELVVLDDAEVEQLNRGDTVAGLTLDAIESMSTTELRAALRDHKQQLEAKDKVLADRNQKLQAAEERLHRPYTPKPDSVAQTQEQEAALKELQVAFALAHTNTMRVAAVCSDVFDRFDGTPLADHARACIDDIVRALAGMASTHGINVDLTLKEALTPAWLPR